MKVGSGIYSLCGGAWLGFRLISCLQLVSHGKDQVLAGGRSIRDARAVVVFVFPINLCNCVQMSASRFRISIAPLIQKRGMMTEVIKSGRKAKKEGDVSVTVPLFCAMAND